MRPPSEAGRGCALPDAAGGPNAGSRARLCNSATAPTHAVAYSNTTTTAIQVKMCS